LIRIFSRHLISEDVRNYYRMNLFITSYYHFLTTGRPQNAYP
jgi:hypothetical protein